MIPTISVHDLPSRREIVGQEIVAAYSNVGFAYISDHGVDQDLLADVFAMSRAFHALAEGEKRLVEVNRFHRGYIPFATSTDRTSTLGEATQPNASESFLMLRELPEGHRDLVDGTYLAGPNQWPSAPTGFREVLLAYQSVMENLAHELIDAIDGALGRDGQITRWFAEPTTWLRLLHYPPQDVSAPADAYGSAPHTDFGAITLLATDDVGGLEVRSPQGSWIEVPPLPGAFVMNVGDILAGWSGGRLRSTPHRVINRSGRERYSVPFFYDPSMRAPITLESNQPPLFADYVRGHLEGSYSHHQEVRA